MPWKISGDYVVRSDTGKRMNKSPIKSRSRLHRYLRALYANAPETVTTKAGYATNQPRYPKGTKLGGRWMPIKGYGKHSNAGTPVSQNLVVQGYFGTNFGRLPLDRACKYIDSVHTEGKMPQIIMEREASPLALLGVLAYYSFNGNKSGKIALLSGTDGEFSAVHEVGHFLDHQGFNPKGKFTTLGRTPRTSAELLGDKPYHGALKQFGAKIHQTESYRTWKKWEKQGYIDGPAGQKIYVDKEVFDYYLSPAEVWARSYAQYIARKAGSPTLLRQLRRAQKSWIPVQWSDKDFRPVEKEIDRLFDSLGWSN